MAHTLGGMVTRPLAWQYPLDPRFSGRQALSGRQWLVGDSLLVAPALEPGVEAVQLALPEGAWCSAWDLADCSAGVSRQDQARSNGQAA